MKTIKIKLIILIMLTVAVSSCKKPVENVSKVVKVSAPTVTLKGDSVLSVSIGGSYSDAGATGTDDLTGATTDLTAVSNNVDLTTPGFYSVVYTTKDANGYTTSKTRLVLVTGVSPSIDISGTYFRESNNQEVHVAKHGTGLYTTDNVGGVAGDPSFVFPVFFGQISDTSIAVPVQPTPLGDLHATSGTLSISPADTVFSYIVINGSFGTSTRVFSHE